LVSVSLSSDVAKWILDLYNESYTESYNTESADLPWSKILAAVTQLHTGTPQDKETLTKRTKIVEEIIATEQKYVSCLTQVVTVFIGPIKENLLLTEKQQEHVFSDIETICELNTLFFKNLEKSWKLWPRSQSIGAVFLANAPLFKVYYPYIHKFNTTLKHLTEYYETVEGFKEFCEKKSCSS